MKSIITNKINNEITTAIEINTYTNIYLTDLLLINCIKPGFRSLYH